MSSRRVVTLLVALALLAAALYGLRLLWHGLSTADEPTYLETVAARTTRHLAIPHQARAEKNPLLPTSDLLKEASDDYQTKCAVCHGVDGSGMTAVGRNLYPKVPDLRAPPTQDLTDGEIRYIIRNGVRLTGMPGWAHPHDEQSDGSWKLVLFIRSLRGLTPAERVQQAQIAGAAHYVGSKACSTCHMEIYARWRKTPMANAVRDPREHPNAIIPDLATNNVSKFSLDQVAFVYGSVWKQRFFTKVGDDYFPLPVQWEIAAHKWSQYSPGPGTDWWTAYYPADNMHRPTGALCDGCHSVDYNIHTKQVAEWNVGCEGCHGPGSAHMASPTRGNILSAARMDYVAASDTCIRCHSQGQPLVNPIEGKYYDWAVGYHPGAKLRDFWKLEDHALGQTNFYYFADGTAHKNRMQGNDFVQSVMYRRGVTCFSCHDVHGTGNYAQLRKSADELCLDCHGPNSLNGPRTTTLEEHTHHSTNSAGSSCIECHMPKIETEIGDVNVRSHTFAFITPAMTDRYGIPNPCTTCHKDKTTLWATGAMRGWDERSPWRLQ
jgi:predicted CXXCH cytochrome family protein